MEGFKEESDIEWKFLDLIRVLIESFMIFDLFPTFFINTMIILKEITMNPFAFTLGEDYEEGMLFGVVNIDILHYLGINEDVDYYWKWYKEWSQEYL